MINPFGDDSILPGDGRPRTVGDGFGRIIVFDYNILK